MFTIKGETKTDKIVSRWLSGEITFVQISRELRNLGYSIQQIRQIYFNLRYYTYNKPN